MTPRRSPAKMTRFLIVTALFGVLSACGKKPVAAGSASHTSRDSAGIEIVENSRPVWSASGAWRLSDQPLFIIHGSDGRSENRLLDPASIDVDSHGRIIIADGNQPAAEAQIVSETTRCGVFRASAPADASVEEAMERLYFLSKVERGLQQADADKTLSHEEVRRRLGL